jgi:hypothetical protein
MSFLASIEEAWLLRVRALIQAIVALSVTAFAMSIQALTSSHEEIVIGSLRSMVNVINLLNRPMDLKI